MVRLMTIGAPRQNGDSGQATPTSAPGQLRPYRRSPLPIQQGQSGVLAGRDRTSDLMSVAQPEMAQRWVVKAHIDDNVCEPCSENNGKTYRNRADAYADYPNGRGYKKCVGAEYGNTCRCRVIKRGRKGGSSNNVKRDLASLIARGQALTASASARNSLPAPPTPAAPAMAVQDFRAQGSALYLYDAIGGWDGTRAIDVAQALSDMTGPIDLHINSPGGFIFEGAAMYNVLKQYAGGPITSWVDGYAASAASFVMLAASPYDAASDTGGIRLASNAFVMVHDGMGLAMGTQQDMYDAGDLLGMLSDSIADIYAARTGGTADEWRSIMTDGDTWYTAQAALDAKLCDLVVGQTGMPGVPTEPDEQPEPPANKLDISMFMPIARRAEPVPADNIAAPIDMDGLRKALKGAMPA